MSKQTEKKEQTSTPQVLCLCGCGAKVVSKKGKFVPGHDMKAKSMIIKNIKANKPMFEGVSAGVVAYAKEKWHQCLVKSIKVNAGKAAVRGQQFETADAKEKVFNAAIVAYEGQLAA